LRHFVHLLIKTVIINMRTLIIMSVAAAMAVAQETTTVETGQLGDATQNFDNPKGAAYRAIVEPNSHNVTGMITAITARDGATEFAVQFANLPSEGGPFCECSFTRISSSVSLTIATAYHLHVDPVASDGNCLSTLAHLDPFVRGEVTPCVRERPETCQVGDLGGKHGEGTETSYNASYTDTFVSLKEGMGAFFGNRSFVLHFANRTRIGCGNFTSLSGDLARPNLLNSTLSSSLAPNLIATPSPNATSLANPAAATSLLFANQTALAAPSLTSTSTPMQVTANAGTAIRTRFDILALVCTLGIACIAL
jgi:hypothetical protein